MQAIDFRSPAGYVIRYEGGTRSQPCTDAGCVISSYFRCRLSSVTYFLYTLPMCSAATFSCSILEEKEKKAAQASCKFNCLFKQSEGVHYEPHNALLLMHYWL